MYREHTVGVVIPAYNEEGFIGDVIRAMPEYVDRIFVIDDCSTDDTWTEILEAARQDADRDFEDEPTRATDRLHSDGGRSLLSERATVHEPVGRVVPVEHRENLGAGGAIKTGYLAAHTDGADITVTVDGDGQMDLSQMTRLLDPIVEDEADYAKGNRLLNGEYRAEMPQFRLVGNWMLTVLTKIASGYWKTMDPQNGYTAISLEALEAVSLEELYEYYGYCNELLIRLNARGMRVADVAMPAQYGDEESSIEYSDYVPKVSGMLLQGFLWRLKTKYLVTNFNPLALFYYLGAGSVGVGLLAGLRSLYTRLKGETPLLERGLSSLLVVLVGCCSLLHAMFLDMRENEELETQLEE
ncbi:glycosyltransferase family 2 protein [Natronococcus sp. A-GB7]|uniref:glycosyltransferase family 2 protein n=1 Tax=Natronococcus sp. A-GB7 TaxID=3037649 RepID=UPI00241DDD4C|nr:glycosyltransferase family 2 protein [Natronococcus sp. A-GB7]MDG5818660.1 glycosyltransferase family 2 protein [Natronococcus sp. A-GB7]